MDFEGACIEQLTLVDYNVPSSKCAFEIIPKTSHSQNKMGIMASITRKNASENRVVQSIIECLSVVEGSQYAALINTMAQRSEKVIKKQRYSILVIRVTDDLGQ